MITERRVEIESKSYGVDSWVRERWVVGFDLTNRLGGYLYLDRGPGQERGLRLKNVGCNSCLVDERK